MGEREEIIGNLRQLLELERASGVEWLVGSSDPMPALGQVAGPARPASAVASRVDPVRQSTPPSTPPRPAAAELPTPVAPPARSVATPTEPPWAPPGDLTSRDASEGLGLIAAAIAACTRCRLCEKRTTVVPGEGAPRAELLFLGEGPGQEEDHQGRPFVGPAGALLDRMIEAMGFRRDEVFIANAVKCRPPGNRTPELDEVAACHPFLMAQIAVLRPKVICTLGNVPLRALFGADTQGITRMRGKRLEWQGLPVYPTFHPSYLLRNESAKKPAWEDLKAVLAELGRTPPAR